MLVPERAPAGRRGGTGGGGRGARSRSTSTPRRSSSSTRSTGVGPATAQKILDYREQHGGFSSVDELDHVPGIGPGRLAALRDLVRV